MFFRVLIYFDMLTLAHYKNIREGHKPSEYANATCLFPKKRVVRLAETGTYENIYCPCGKCVRCQDQRRNDLASRMFLHSLSFNYCYFVTLTYGSYNLLPFKNHPFLNDWLRTIPSYDCHNSFNVPRWSPTILIHEHLTKFFKRLRASLPFEISVAGCGEYGETYFRPHFHVILWSNNPITKQQVLDAWSLDCKRTSDKYFVRPWRGHIEDKTSQNGYFKFNIGSIDFVDLWANGSLDYDGHHSGYLRSVNEVTNGLHNFTYVAKYIGKNNPEDFYSNRPNWFMQRIRYAYSIYVLDSVELTKLAPHPTESMLGICERLNNLIFNDYELQQISFFDFEKMVAPFFTSSRRPSLGKLYYLSRRKDFLAGSKGLPKFMGKTINYPKYFNYLLQRDSYPIRLRKNVPSGVSLTKDLLPRLYRYMEGLHNDPNYYFYVRGYFKDAEGYFRRSSYLDRFEDYSLSEGCDITDSAGTLDHIDFVYSDSTLVHYYYNAHYEIFEGYIYDPHSREYQWYDYYERQDFCDFVMEQIENQYDNICPKIDHIRALFEAQDAIEHDPDTPNKRQQFLCLRKDMNNQYISQHKNDL